MSAPRHVSGPLPTMFRCEFDAEESRYEYEYSVSLSENEMGADDSLSNGGSMEWQESCRSIGADSRVVWSVDSGTVISDRDSEFKMALPSGTGLLHTSLKGLPEAIKPIAEAVKSLLRGFLLVPTELPRSLEEKTELVLKRQTGKAGRARPEERQRLVMLANQVLRLNEYREDDYQHLRSLFRRVMDIELDVVYYGGEEPSSNEEVAEIMLGSDNIGLASDGTLRALDILLALARARPRDLVVIEEPEMCVHPGLLNRILNEIESWSSHGQVLMSTHSPVVLDWRSGTPASLRFVSRQAGATTVRPIRESEQRRLLEYIQDEGSMSDFVFNEEEDD
ncbi:MAG: ATP-binding protein [Nannocystaceae bacterium]